MHWLEMYVRFGGYLLLAMVITLVFVGVVYCLIYRPLERGLELWRGRNERRRK